MYFFLRYNNAEKYCWRRRGEKQNESSFFSVSFPSPSHVKSLYFDICLNDGEVRLERTSSGAVDFFM